MCKIFQWKTLQSLWLNTFYLTKYKLPIVKSWCCTKEPFETRISFKSFNIWTKCGAKMNWKYIPQNWSFHWNRALITFVVEVTIKVFRLCSELIGSGIDWEVFKKTFLISLVVQHYTFNEFLMQTEMGSMKIWNIQYFSWCLHWALCFLISIRTMHEHQCNAMMKWNALVYRYVNIHTGMTKTIVRRIVIYMAML